MIPLTALSLAACVAVGASTDHILLRDLAPAFPAAAVSSPDIPVALAPAPGVVRRFPIPELHRISLRLHLEAEPGGEMCVTRPVLPPDPDRFLTAMRARFPQASIELVDFSRWPVPEGEIEFLPAGLHQDYWRGDVVYSGNLRFGIWAKVKVHIAVQRVVAVRDLPARRPIEASSLRLDAFDTAPAPERYVDSIAAVVGKLPRRAVATNAAIRVDWLDDPPLVSRGDTVKVEVRSGAAVLRLDGRALADGAGGQTIPVLNPATGKRFRARIEGPGRVLMENLP
jgi:flagella basal body P-ring formation protein FlgA